MTISTVTTERLREIIERRSPSLRWGEAEKVAAELLAVREAQSVPVQWGAPKTVRQLIQQLQTLDPELETTALLRMPADFRDGKAVRQVPLVISYERMDEQWLAPYNGNGRKVLAFWAKADHRPEGERGEVLTTLPASAVPQSDHLKRALKLAGEAKELADRIRAEELTLQAPVVPDDVAAVLDWIDDFIARCNGDDRGSCDSVNILRRAILAAMPATD
ncbi:Uncharacterised protein [Serratia fonticola]|uniref:hypothetical protein n=1 Tax=Serratia fonticola TaxID=47917 RepID=UPI00217CBBBD|nr:hypothetical protein [Serratia fonticola]CAI1703164.1 Uncharacterised protein [Serratia fonticola]